MRLFPLNGTEESFSVIRHFPAFKPFSVVHSTRAPAVGYRVTAGQSAIFYMPNVVYIRSRKEALAGVKLYIGDGATIERSMVRKTKVQGKLIGHVPIRTQLTWCQKEGLSRAIMTHCGSGSLTWDEPSDEKISPLSPIRSPISFDDWAKRMIHGRG